MHPPLPHIQINIKVQNSFQNTTSQVGNNTTQTQIYLVYNNLINQGYLRRYNYILKFHRLAVATMHNSNSHYSTCICRLRIPTYYLACIRACTSLATPTNTSMCAQTENATSLFTSLHEEAYLLSTSWQYHIKLKCIDDLILHELEYPIADVLCVLLRYFVGPYTSNKYK